MNRFFIHLLALIFLAMAPGSCKKAGATVTANSAPLVNLEAFMINANTFAVSFIANASDADNDPLRFTWDFGEGTVKEAGSTIIFTFANKCFNIVRR